MERCPGACSWEDPLGDLCVLFPALPRPVRFSDAQRRALRPAMAPGKGAPAHGAPAHGAPHQGQVPVERRAAERRQGERRGPRASRP